MFVFLCVFCPNIFFIMKGQLLLGSGQLSIFPVPGFFVLVFFYIRDQVRVDIGEGGPRTWSRRIYFPDNRDNSPMSEEWFHSNLYTFVHHTGGDILVLSLETVPGKSRNPYLDSLVDNVK